MSQVNYITLWMHMACIPDPRGDKGKRYEWSYLLTLIAAALLAGHKSLLAISQWVSLQGAVFIGRLHPQRREIPSYATLRRVLCQVDLDILERHLAIYTQALDEDDRVGGRIETRDGRYLWGQAVDGKTLRGASAHGQPVHLVSIVRHENASVLGQIPTAHSIDEPQVARALLARLPLAHTVTTMDALYTERALAEQILEAGGEYFMVVKSNQGKLYEHMDLAFSEFPLTSSWERDEWGYDSDSSIETLRGRREVRRLERITALNHYLGWPQVGQVMRRTYRRLELRTGKISHEVHYGITSLPPDQVSVSQLAQLWRWHWTIENCTHYIRDVSLGEDHCQVRSGNAPQALAAFRNALVTALRLEGWANVPNALRHFNCRPQDALLFLGATAK